MVAFFLDRLSAAPFEAVRWTSCTATLRAGRRLDRIRGAAADEGRPACRG